MECGVSVHGKVWGVRCEYAWRGCGGGWRESARACNVSVARGSVCVGCVGVVWVWCRCCVDVRVGVVSLAKVCEAGCGVLARVGVVWVWVWGVWVSCRWRRSGVAGEAGCGVIGEGGVGRLARVGVV